MTQAYLTPLTLPNLRAAGIADPFCFGMADRVRFGELDVLGHVNNAAYLGWFENFRIHYFRDYGISTYTGTPPRIVLRALDLEFLAEVLLNQDYIVTGRTSHFRTTSFTMEYGVWIDGRQTTKSHAVIVNLDDDGSKQRLPAAWIESFKQRDGAIQS